MALELSTLEDVQDFLENLAAAGASVEIVDEERFANFLAYNYFLFPDDVGEFVKSDLYGPSPVQSAFHDFIYEDTDLGNLLVSKRLAYSPAYTDRGWVVTVALYEKDEKEETEYRVYATRLDDEGNLTFEQIA